MARIWHFCNVFHFYPILAYYKIRTRANFENPNGKKFRSTSDNVIYAERIFPRVNRFYSGHIQNTPNIKTFSGYACFDNRDFKQRTASGPRTSTPSKRDWGKYGKTPQDVVCPRSRPQSC